MLPASALPAAGIARWIRGTVEEQFLAVHSAPEKHWEAYTAVYKHLAAFTVDFACFLQPTPFVPSVFHWLDVLLGIRHLPPSSPSLHGFFSGCANADVHGQGLCCRYPSLCSCQDLSRFPLSPSPPRRLQVPTVKPDLRQSVFFSPRCL